MLLFFLYADWQKVRLATERSNVTVVSTFAENSSQYNSRQQHPLGNIVLLSYNFLL